MEKQTEGKQEKTPNIARELWFREKEKELIEQHQLMATIRAGDRTAETTDPKGGYQEGRFITLKIQKADGQFDPWQTEAVPYSVEKKVLGEIEPKDLEGTPLKTKTRAELVEKLKRLYGREFTDDDIVTIVRFEYKDNLKNEMAIRFLNEIGDLAENDIGELKDRPFQLEMEYKPRDPIREIIMRGRHLSFIIGENPSEYSVSPLMWNAEYKLRNGNEIFLPADISVQIKENLTKFFEKAVAVGSSVLRVLTITNPYKVEAFEYFRRLKEQQPERVVIDEDAQRIGATNQILIGPDDKFYVINSDGQGMVNSVKRFWEENRKGEAPPQRIGLIGAGGAARGIAYAVAKLLHASNRGELTIFNRTYEKAVQLAEELKRYFPQLKIEAQSLDALVSMAKGQEVVISSITEGDPLLDYNVYPTLHSGMLIADVNYGTKSFLKKNARSRGRNDLNIRDGSGMVVEGYIIPSRKLSKLWGYNVPQEVYQKIGKLFNYTLKKSVENGGSS